MGNHIALIEDKAKQKERKGNNFLQCRTSYVLRFPMEHPPDTPAPASMVYDPGTDLHFPSEEARLFTLRGAKDARGNATLPSSQTHSGPASGGAPGGSM
jgi:hypothetical protein